MYFFRVQGIVLLSLSSCICLMYFMQSAAIMRFMVIHLHNNIIFTDIKTSSLHGDSLVIILFQSLLITSPIQHSDGQLLHTETCLMWTEHKSDSNRTAAS